MEDVSRTDKSLILDLAVIKVLVIIKTLKQNMANIENTVDSCYNKLLGPSEITVILKFCYIRVAKTKIQRNFELWDQENYNVLCYISVLYNESPLYPHF